MTEAQAEELAAELERYAVLAEATANEMAALHRIAGAAAHIFEHDGPVRTGARELLLEAVKSAQEDFDAIGALECRGGGFETMFARRCELRLGLAIELADWLHRFGREVSMTGEVRSAGAELAAAEEAEVTP
jgi:hypothetical protein